MLALASFDEIPAPPGQISAWAGNKQRGLPSASSGALILARQRLIPARLGNDCPHQPNHSSARLRAARTEHRPAIMAPCQLRAQPTISHRCRRRARTVDSPFRKPPDRTGGRAPACRGYLRRLLTWNAKDASSRSEIAVSGGLARIPMMLSVLHPPFVTWPAEASALGTIETLQRFTALHSQGDLLSASGHPPGSGLVAGSSCRRRPVPRFRDFEILSLPHTHPPYAQDDGGIGVYS